MKTLLRLLFAACVAAAGVATASAQASLPIAEELRRVATLDRALDEGGVGGVLAATLPAPLIRSAYYAEILSTREPARRELEAAKRNFGLKLARALDKRGEQQQARVDAAERERQAVQMLDLADWLKAAPGYGNYLLFSRSESLATVPLVYLTADLDYPIAKITALRGRIVPMSEERALRVAVLHSEAPEPFVGALQGTSSEQDEQIAIAWGGRWKEMTNWFKARGITSDKRQRSALPENLAFFLDDEPLPEPFTTSHLWALKNHHALIYGQRDVMVRNLDSFMLYREKVGTFPTEPPQWWKDAPIDRRLDTALEAAFEHASKHLPRENGQRIGYSGPAMLYQQSQEGTVIDRETSEKRQAEAAKRRQSGKP